MKAMLGTVDGVIHFTVQHASVYHRVYSRRMPWLLYREVGYGGFESFSTRAEAMAWANKLNPKVTWHKEI